ncbi:UDP-N-acetyl-D-mannosamine dehydrogenase [Candidatus Venteria ishoeyi]|uniref:UDP-N-acetyl-D-glucosamine 6-dehydrogenase n=1 Tax=Candidatus Venteria ishoeyi TaxID=1899563 RepID=A0A1H6F870_9GAMM|nr:UDP-N-acetyl-D-mannosamine dehydrogenase [Candidatus Venteria ishoeyi]SEH05611.1 UDP-N-acetyl-D-glucosamine 6-dehydrogenase [Candidatus Venteria ishoeyi]
MSLTVNMIGLGYIGLPTAAILASHGIKVIGVDRNQDVVNIINQGEIHIVEPGLEEIVKLVVSEGELRATFQPEPADAFLIAVPTPFKQNHEPDISYIEAAIQSIAPVLQQGNCIILESTSPVGTTEKILEQLAQLRPDLKLPDGDSMQVGDISLAYCPERVLPGNIIHELIENDRVIGGITPHCSEQAAKVYKHFVRGALLLTNARTAELCKLTENAYRDVNIAFANELSLICDQLNINVWELIRLSNHHPRVNILQPGPGVGGHCIAVDPWFIVHSSPEQARLIRQARHINDSKPAYVVSQVLTAIQNIANPSIACLGLTFKPDIDDLRESPAMQIVEMLAKQGTSKLLVTEPHIETLPQHLLDINVEILPATEAIAQADVVLLLVNHTAFEGYVELTKNKIVIDTRGIWSL